MRKFLKNAIFTASAAIFLTAAFVSNAANFGDSQNFYIDQGFDSAARTQIQATLVNTQKNLYFYVEKSWWDSQNPAKKDEVFSILNALSTEFDDRIYPTLTSVFGSEWKPGVDGDNRITILFSQMKEGAGGYFRSADEYIKLQVPNSNEREMLYLPLAQIGDSQLKILLAHEFVHMITFNQKDKTFGISDEVWLNEARADYTSTILRYDDNFNGSNLQLRLEDFLEKPGDSLPEWQETKYDYAVDSLFTHYLVDHYSINVLIDSLHSKLVGIASLDHALQKNSAKENFIQIFTNWTIATLINDCSLNSNYCYLNQNLKDLRITPTLNFLPLTGDSSLSVSNVTKNWAGNWQKIIGGNGNLKLDFSSLIGLNFQAPYILYDKKGGYKVNFLTLDKNEKGEINIKNFDQDYASLILIPSLQSKTSDFDGLEFTYPYTFTVSVTSSVSKEDSALIKKLLAQIDALKKQIADLQAKKGVVVASCRITSDLYFGVLNSSQVSCLQTFLKSQPGIYPEGFVTGVFGKLTMAAVIRFQEKYASEILAPVGLLKGSGIVGQMTRNKISQLSI